jgi:hypothetical protein
MHPLKGARLTVLYRDVKFDKRQPDPSDCRGSGSAGPLAVPP